MSRDSSFSSNLLLVVIVLCQFLCTSLWFAGNAVVDDLASDLGFSSGVVSSLTSSVQLGFVFGTLVFAFFSISDRVPSTFLFLICAIAAAGVNFLAVFAVHQMWFVVLRFGVGFFLAGIYPIGMKIASDIFPKGLGKALGFLVGALVLGTALPHAIKGSTFGLDWKLVLTLVSMLAVVGGVLLFFTLPKSKRSEVRKFDPTVLWVVFKDEKLRRSAFGYFGHMFELYTFWAFVPFFISLHHTEYNASLISFFVIAIGAVGCVVSGFVAVNKGAAKTAILALSVSGLCCVLFPFALQLSWPLYFAFLLVWAFAVIADSPLLSTLVATLAPKENKGSALTIVNCLGFSITIISIQAMEFFSHSLNEYAFMLLAVGPICALASLRKLS